MNAYWRIHFSPWVPCSYWMAERINDAKCSGHDINSLHACWPTHRHSIYIYIHMAYVDISYDAYVMYEIMKHIVIYSYSFPPMSCLMGPLYEKQAVG